MHLPRLNWIAPAFACLVLAACPSAPPDPSASASEVESPTETGSEEPAGDGIAISYREKAIETTEIVDAPETGIDLGWGWDTFESRAVPTVCIEFVEQMEPAQSRRLSMKEVSDSYELMESMDISAEASVKTIGFEVSGKAAFAKDLNISSFASNFVLNASVDNGVRYAAPRPAAASEGAKAQSPGGEEIRLTEQAAELASQDIEEFKHRCGNAFVAAVYSGAKLTAVLTIQESNRREQERLSAELSGSGWGARFEGSLEKMAETDTESKRVNLSIFQVGGRGDAIPVSREDLVEKMADLSSLAFDAPKDFRIAVTPYQYLSNWPQKQIVGEEQEYEALASFWGAYNTLYDEIQQVLEDPATFRAVGLRQFQPRSDVEQVPGQTCQDLVRLDAGALEQLRSAQDELLARLVQLKEMAQTCTQVPADCEMDVSGFRSPYAYRALLPIPIDPSDEGDSDDTDNLDEGLGVVGRYHIEDTAKRRCAIDVQNRGCLSNAQIAYWQQRIGMYQVALGGSARRSLLASVDTAAEVCDGAARPAYLEEEGSDVLWYDPSRAEAVEKWLAENAPIRVRTGGARAGDAATAR